MCLKRYTVSKTDRMSSGLVATGLDVGGQLDFELAPDTYYDDFFSAGMMSDWIAAAALSTDVTLTPVDAQSAALVITGDFSAIGPGVAVNDVLQLVPVTGNPVVVSVTAVTSTTELTVATVRDQAAIAGVTMSVQIPAHLLIGKNQKSFTIGHGHYVAAQL